MKDGGEFEHWFEASWDEEYIYVKISPPEQVPRQDTFHWSAITRICFESTNHLYCNTLYFFTTERPNSYVIPIEAKGGNELWELVLKKNLFDAELAIQALASVEGIFCYTIPKPS